VCHFCTRYYDLVSKKKGFRTILDGFYRMHNPVVRNEHVPISAAATVVIPTRLAIPNSAKESDIVVDRLCNSQCYPTLRSVAGYEQHL
jgi:hypothetical protein